MVRGDNELSFEFHQSVIASAQTRGFLRGAHPGARRPFQPAMSKLPTTPPPFTPGLPLRRTLFSTLAVGTLMLTGCGGSGGGGSGIPAFFPTTTGTPAAVAPAPKAPGPGKKHGHGKKGKKG